MSIAKILRGNYVRRFHANPDLAHVGDTVGHHHAAVAQIVLHLWPTASCALLRQALHHDAAEQFVGDLPQPFKAASPDFAREHARIEGYFAAEMGIDDILTDREEAVLKLADRLAAYLHVRHVAPYVLGGSGWPEDRAELLRRAWALGADMAAKVEAVLK